jgi:hypothetical protein
MLCFDLKKKGNIILAMTYNKVDLKLNFKIIV